MTEQPQPNPAPQGGVEVAPGVRMPDNALRFSATRSSGPGGQNVNKVATRVELRVSLSDIPLTDAAMMRLRRQQRGRINAEDELIVTSEETRSQHRNRERCLTRFREMIVRARFAPKPRKPTKPTKGSIRRRLEAKRQRGERKRQRRPPDVS